MNLGAVGSIPTPGVYTTARGRGGNGRRGGLKPRWAQALGGSIPLARIYIYYKEKSKSLSYRRPEDPPTGDLLYRLLLFSSLSSFSLCWQGLGTIPLVTFDTNAPGHVPPADDVLQSGHAYNPHTDPTLPRSAGATR